MKIKSIYINGLHNAVNKIYNFGDIVYIFGNNGIGKSTILQAIQFALLGYIPGTAKNSKDAILRHSPVGEIDVKLTITDDSGNDVLISRKVNSSGNKLSTLPENYDLASIISDIEVPIFNFNEFVGQTANKLKEYFIKNILPTVNGELDWKHILSDSVTDCNFSDKDSIIDYGLSLVGDLDGTLLDQVIAANAKFKDEQSFNKAEIQRLQNTVDSLIYYDDYIGPTNLDEINSQLVALSVLRDQVISYDSAVSATKLVVEDLAKLEDYLNLMGGKSGYEQLQAKLVLLNNKYTELSAEISNTQTELTAIRTKDNEAGSIIKSNGICPYTKDVCKAMTTKIEDLRNESVKYKAVIVKLTEIIENKTTELNDIHLNIRKCESAINEFNKAWERVESLRKQTSSLPQKPNTDKTIYEINNEIDELNKSKSKLESNIRYNETIENITNLKYEAELKNQALTRWVKATDTNGLQTTLMQKPFEELATTMTGYIQKMYDNSGLKAHFNISSKANSFSFGLMRDDVYIPYDLLSSGEKCLYALALMICITNNSKSPLNVLLLDDAFDHLDQHTIENTFATLKNIQGIQFIFAGVKECKNAADIILTV